MTRPSGREPGLGGHWRPEDVSGREPALGGDRRFDRMVWERLLQPADQETVIDGLTPAQCEMYVHLLLQIFQPASTQSLILQGREDWHRPYGVQPRQAALSALGLLGKRLGEEPIESLSRQILPIFKDQSIDRLIRVEAARTLGTLGHPSVEDTLLRAASSQSDIRWAALEAIGELGTAQALDYLFSLLEEESSLSITDLRAVLNALGRVGAHREGELRERIFQLLMTRFTRGGTLVRAAAATALGILGDERSLDSLIRTAIFARYSLQEAAIQALGLLGHPQAAPSLVGLLATGDDSLRQLATESLIRLGPEAGSAVLPLLHHHDARVRRDAAYVLGKIQARQATSQLIEALEDLDSEVREMASRALGAIGDPSAIMPLTRALKDSAAAVRKAAALVLGSFRDPRTVGPLCLALWDLDATVRWFAAYSLGTIGDERAIPSLCQVLNDRFEDAALASSDALANIGEAAIPALTERIQNGPPRARRLAHLALERIGET